MNTSQTIRPTEQAGTAPRQVAGGDKAIWVFLAILAVLFWGPNLILAMEWTEYWITFLTEVFIWSMFAVAFNLLMGYTGMSRSARRRTWVSGVTRRDSY